MAPTPVLNPRGQDEGNTTITGAAMTKSPYQGRTEPKYQPLLSAVGPEKISDADCGRLTGQTRSGALKLEELTAATAGSAIRLLRGIWPHILDESERPELTFPASLLRNTPSEYEKFMSSGQNREGKEDIERVAAGVEEIRYWVIVDEGKKVIGTIGLYTYPQDKNEAYWVGWFALDPDYRGRGLGRELLDFAIAEAQKAGKQYLRLYTTTHPTEIKANELYLEYGFTSSILQAGARFGFDGIETLDVLQYQLNLPKPF